MSNNTDRSLLKNYIVKKIFWTIIALLLVVVANILLNKYAGEYFNNIAQKVSGNYTVAGLAFF